MKPLTKSDKQKLAKAARELAYEIAEGEGPKLHPASWHSCAMGMTLKRAGVGTRTRLRDLSSEIDKKYDLVLSRATWLVYGYVWDSDIMVKPIPTAPVFPLLYIADELERSANDLDNSSAA